MSIEKCRKIIDNQKLSGMDKDFPYCIKNSDGVLIPIDAWMSSAWAAGKEEALKEEWERRFDKVISECPDKDLLYVSIFKVMESIKFSRNPNEYIKKLKEGKNEA